jgi:hypothetical protein
VATVGSGWAFVLDAVSFGASGVLLYRLHIPKSSTVRARRFLTEFKEGWAEFRSRGWILAIDAWAAFANMTVLSAFFVLGPVIARQDLGGAPAWAAILVGFGVGSLVGDAVALAATPSRPLLVGCGALSTWAAPLALLALGAPVAAVVAATFVAALTLSLFNALFVTALQQHVPADALSRVTAYDWLASVGISPLGLALVAPLAAAVGQTRVLLLAAGAHLVWAAGVISIPSVRGLRRVEPREAGALEAVPSAPR